MDHHIRPATSTAHSLAVAAAALVMALAAADGASALELNRPAGIDSLTRPNPAIDLPNLESRRSRRDFQQLQQIYREQDRNSATSLPAQVDVPQFRTPCPQASGNHTVTICR